MFVYEAEATTEETAMNKSKRAENQILFCTDLMNRLMEDWQENLDRSKKYTYLTVANGSQMVSDARRIRRELLRFIKILEGGD